jgi:3-oxoacyl-[acyl-carrier protein] reductase
MLLKNKNAVVTGCARGIGRSILKVFAENGANIWACYRKSNDEFEQYLRTLAKDNGVSITPLCFDLSDSEQVKNAMRSIISSKQKIDILVNNAGITFNALFQMTSIEKMREIFEINFFSQMLITQYIVKIMVKNREGSIINISSTAALDANSGRSAYGSSKAALICSTKTISQELGEYNVRANCIAPGITETDMVTASMTQETIQDTIKRSKLKRMGRTTEIADTALFLASDLSSYITGQVIRVDGGLAK